MLISYWIAASSSSPPISSITSNTAHYLSFMRRPRWPTNTYPPWG
jgi:hypothetical protein